MSISFDSVFIITIDKINNNESFDDPIVSVCVDYPSAIARLKEIKSGYSN